MGVSIDPTQPSSITRPKIHPIWRGIGFVFMTLMPILAFYLTSLILTLNETNQWFEISKTLLAKGSDPLLYLKIGGTIVIVFIAYLLFMIITFASYRMFGPPRVGPLDAPQTSIQGKKGLR
jgi:hypothetical protein